MDNNFISNIVDTIKLVADKEIESRPADLTVNAQIVKVKNFDTGEYIVSFQGNMFTAYSLDVTVVYKKDDAVFVLVPRGDYTTKKIILRWATIGDDESNLSEVEQGQIRQIPVPRGPNWIDPLADWYVYAPKTLPLKIVAGQSPPIAPLDYIDTLTMDLATAPQANLKLQLYGKQFDKVYFKADFLTKFSDIHNAGSYSLRAVCYEQILDANGVVVEEQEVYFDLGFPNFIGQPFNYSTWVTNYAVFEVTPGSLVGLRRISLMQDGAILIDNIGQTVNPVTGVITSTPNTTQHNIFADNIVIQFCEIVDATGDMFYLNILEPRGNQISPALAPLPLVGDLRYGLERIPLDTEECEVYWYKENTLVEYGTSNYDRLAGFGWELVPAAYNATPLSIQVPYQIGAVVEIPWQWRYKLVVIYNGNKFEAITTIYNQNPLYEFYIECTTSLDNTQTFLEVKSSLAGQENIVYWANWHLYLPDGSYTLLSGVDAVEGKFEVTHLTVNPMMTFYAAARETQNGVVLGNPSYTMVSPDITADFFIDWDGPDSFNYDAQGNKTFVTNSFQDDFVCVADLVWGTGKTKDYFIEMLAPDETVLVPQPMAANNAYQGYSPDGSMLKNIFVDNFIDTGFAPKLNNLVIHYKIYDKFDLSKTNNRLGIRVRVIDGRVFTFWRQIRFSKDGQLGTNGTGFKVILRPVEQANPLEPIQDQSVPLIYNTNTNTWVAASRFRLRPFVYYNDQLVETMGASAYTYTVTYDVRRPTIAAVRPNASHIQLVDFGALDAPAYTKLNIPNGTFYGGVGVQGNADNINPLTGGDPACWVRCEVNISQNGVLIQTVTDIYSVDFFHGAYNGTLDRNFIKTNWPTTMEYNPTGYDPQTAQGALYFYYTDIDTRPLYAATAVNANLARIEVVNGEQFFKAKDYFFWNTGTFSVLRTTVAVDGVNATFYRTQVQYLNAFSNTDINGWDGLGIAVKNDPQTGNNYILAPTIGAGYKQPISNTFTGVVMGIDTSQLKSTYQNSITGEQGFTAQDIAKNQYMVGLYGYQDGIASFGLMENGTMFLGRADRGGRIILDGLNGTIYGGYTGNNNAPVPNPVIPNVTTTAFPMWNRMKLNLVDMSQAATTNGAIQVDSQTSLNNSFFQWNDYPLWYRRYVASYNANTGYQNPDSNPSPNPPNVQGGLNNGFGVQVRVSTTPAIEIGQNDGRMPPIMGNGIVSSIMRNQWSIPGNRNFLVTYDGTMWCRNAIIQGNVITSNIITPRIMGENYIIDDENIITVGQGISNGVGTWTYWTFGSSVVNNIQWGDFSIRQGTFGWAGGGALPGEGVTTVRPGAFNVDTDGKLWAAEAHIADLYAENFRFGGQYGTGGSLTIGGIHIDETGVMIGPEGSYFEVISDISMLWGNVGLGGDIDNNIVTVGNTWLGHKDQGGILPSTLVKYDAALEIERMGDTQSRVRMHPMMVGMDTYNVGTSLDHWFQTETDYSATMTLGRLYVSNYFKVSWGVQATTILFCTGDEGRSVGADTGPDLADWHMMVGESDGNESLVWGMIGNDEPIVIESRGRNIRISADEQVQVQGGGHNNGIRQSFIDLGDDGILKAAGRTEGDFGTSNSGDSGVAFVSGLHTELTGLRLTAPNEGMVGIADNIHSPASTFPKLDFWRDGRISLVNATGRQLLLDNENLTVQGYDAEHQIGIYARFG